MDLPLHLLDAPLGCFLYGIVDLSILIYHVLQRETLDAIHAEKYLQVFLVIVLSEEDWLLAQVNLIIYRVMLILNRTSTSAI